MADQTPIQIKRTSVSGREANTSTLTNPGELAINMTDGIMFSTNGSVVFPIGANNVSIRASNNFYVGNDSVNVSINSTSITIESLYDSNNSPGSDGQVLTSDGSTIYWSTLSSTVNTNEQYAWSNVHTFSANVSFLGSSAICMNNLPIYLDVDKDTLIHSVGDDNIGIVVGGSYRIMANNALFWSNLPFKANNNVQIGNNFTLSFGTGSANVIANSSYVIVGNSTANVNISRLRVVLNNRALYLSDFGNSSYIQTYSGGTGFAVVSNNVYTLWHDTNNWTFRDNIVPHANLTYDIGSSTKYISSFYSDNIFVNSLNDSNNSPGSDGQVLTSNGSTIYWNDASSIIDENAQYTWTNTHTFQDTLTVSNGINANGSIGTNGQILTSNGTVAYWSTSTSATTGKAFAMALLFG